MALFLLGVLAAAIWMPTQMQAAGLFVLDSLVEVAPLVVPGIIVGISILIIVNWVGVPLSLYTIAFAHLPGCTAFSLWIMISRLEGFAPAVEEASLDLGVGPWMTFWRVTFPLVFPGVLSSMLLCFIISFDEFIIAFFLAGTDPTLPLFIYSQLRFPQKLPGTLALGACIIMVSFLVVALNEWYRRRSSHGISDTGL